MSTSISLPTPIVSVKWLQEHLNNENLIILDGTINKVFNVSQKQIPGTRLFDIKKKFSDVSNPFPSAFPSEEQFQREARNLGVNNNSAIVVYDDKGIYSSARVWWLFKAFGYNNVAVLNGGFPEWLNAGYATESMTNYEGAIGDFFANLQPKFMQFFDDVKVASTNKTHTIIDARSAGRFNCEVPEPREGLRMGTIPNSVNLPFTALLEGNTFKPQKDWEALFDNVAQSNQQLVFTCGSGITASVLSLAATILGYNNSVYDGSWTEYGSLIK